MSADSLAYDASVDPGDQARALLRRIGELYENDHIILTSDLHSPAYVNHRPLARPEHWAAFRILARLMGGLLAGIDADIQAVVGPETFGWPLTQWSVFEHNRLRKDRPLASVMVAKVESERTRAEDAERAGRAADAGFYRAALEPLKDPKAKFFIPDPFRSKLAGTRCVILDDVLTTSKSAHEVMPLIEAAGGTFAGLAVSCDRSGKAADELDLPATWSLFTLAAPTWSETGCPMCKAGKPVNETVGHGKKYMDAKRAAAPTAA